MNRRPLIILHGWSDNAKSFQHLATLLQTKLPLEPQLIDLADYVTMDDDVTFADLTMAMMRAWEIKKLPQTPGSVDVIVHSTGGLVIRDWLLRYFKPETAPVKHLLMLAPANFGSQLAHRGRAFYGRIIKGFASKKMFNVGARLLKGLELASPYTWQLAMADRFNHSVFYEPGKILCTVLIGNSGYSGISAAANEVGSDGTVRASCANLNCAYLQADFSQNPLHPAYSYSESNGICAFAVLEDENHGTITGKENGYRNPATFSLIQEALQVDDGDFADWCSRLNQITQTTMEKNKDNSYKQGYQNTVVYVEDQLQQQPDDYFIEFYAGKDGQWFEEMFYQEVIKSVHAYSDNKIYRSIYFDCTTFYQHLHKDWEQLNISLSALPEFQKKKNMVGYRTFTDEDIGSIQIAKDDISRLFIENRTLLVQMKIRREQTDELFVLRSI